MSVEYLGLSKPVNRIQPLLSVRLITYNHAPFIRQCLDAVLMQVTDFPFEIVIGEDDSTDGTREICMEYARRHPDWIRLMLRSQADKIILDGVTTSRYNFVQTMKDCRGEFISLLDGDDWWTDPRKLQMEADALSQDSMCILTFHNARYVNARGRVLSPSVLLQKQKRDVTALELQKAWGPPVTSTLCVRNVIRDFPREFNEVINGDCFLVSLLGKFGGGRYLAEVKPTMYRLHKASMFSSLSDVKSLEFVGKTFFRMSKYYERVKEATLALHFMTEEKKLSDILESKWKRGFFVLRKRLFRFQLIFLHDIFRTLLQRLI